MNEPLKEIHAYIDDHFNEHLERIREYLRQPSICFTGEGMKEGAEMTLRYLRELKPEVAALVPESLPPPSPKYPKGGYPVVYAKVRSKNPKAKTLLIYGMYDVMPVYPEWGDEWTFPPFEARMVEASKVRVPKEIGKVIIARGAQNSKGSLLAFINAVKSIREVTGDIPVNLVFGIDGEEERGSLPSYYKFVEEYAEELKNCDAELHPRTHQEPEALGMYPTPQTILLGLKGYVEVKLEIKGGDWGGLCERDMSSTQCNWIDMPAWRLIMALSTMMNRNGDILIDGFYDNMRPLTSNEKHTFAALAERLDERIMKKTIGIKKFARGRSGKELFTKYWYYPNLNLTGMRAGSAEPPWTSIPHKASAVLAIRFPPNMTSKEIVSKIREHLDKHGFPEIKIGTPEVVNEYSTTSSEEPLAQVAIKISEKMSIDYVVIPVDKPSCGDYLLNKNPINLPMVNCGPGYGGRMHQADEWLQVEGIHINEKYMASLLYEYAESSS